MFAPGGTHGAEVVHQLGGHWVTQLDLAIQRLLPEVLDQVHEALELRGGAQKVHVALLLDAAVFDLTVASE